MKKVKIYCPNCNEIIFVNYGKNKWVEWFKGFCEQCGYKFLLKEKDIDALQPDSPLFKLVYKFNPEKEAEKKQKIKEYKEQQKKVKLEKKYWKMGKNKEIKPYEKRYLEKEVLK